MAKAKKPTQTKKKKDAPVQEPEVKDETPVQEPETQGDEVNDTAPTAETEAPAQDQDTTPENEAPAEPEVTEGESTAPAEPEGTTPEAEADGEGDVAEDETPAPEHATVIFAKDRLGYYVENMALNRPQTPKSLAQLQLTFVNVVETLFRTEGEVFGKILDEMIAMVENNRKQFTLAHAYRGFEQLTQMPKRIRLAKQMLNLIITAADCKDKKKVGELIDLRLFNNSVDGVQQELLASYFS